MTRTLRIAIVLAVAAGLPALGACKKAQPKPSDAFQEWLLAVEKCDSAAMRAGMTKQSALQVEQLMKQLQAFVPEDKRGKLDLMSELCKGYRKGAIQVQGETVNGDQAVVKVLNEGKPLDAPMSFEDGAWKLDFAALMKATISSKTRESTGTSSPAPDAPKPAVPLG